MWIRWCVRRYGLDHRTIPPCWYQHGALVEELSALRTGWQAAHTPTAPGNACRTGSPGPAADPTNTGTSTK